MHRQMEEELCERQGKVWMNITKWLNYIINII